MLGLAVKGLMVAALGAPVSGAMGPITVNGYRLTGAEYLPFIGDQTFHYPDDVLWGFYPNGATDAAKGCAETAFSALRQLFTQDPALLRQAASLGSTPCFVLWINDYSQSAPREQTREGRLWHASPDLQDYRHGTWVWEATLTSDGSCQLPSDAEVEEALQGAVHALER